MDLDPPAGGPLYPKKPPPQWFERGFSPTTEKQGSRLSPKFLGKMIYLPQKNTSGFLSPKKGKKTRGKTKKKRFFPLSFFWINFFWVFFKIKIFFMEDGPLLKAKFFKNFLFLRRGFFLKIFYLLVGNRRKSWKY